VQGDDEVIIFDFTVRPVFDDDGAVTVLIPEGRDITALKEREQQLETVIDNLPGYVYRHEYDSAYPLVFVKGDAETVTGYTTAELENDVQLAEKIIHPDDRDNLWAEHIEMVESTGRFDSIYRIITKDGDVRWIRDQGQLIEDPVSGEEFIEGFITDVSDQRSVDETLDE
jgi:PAS domain S-box-containing protein